MRLFPNFNFDIGFFLQNSVRLLGLSVLLFPVPLLDYPSRSMAGSALVALSLINPDSTRLKAEALWIFGVYLAALLGGHFPSDLGMLACICVLYISSALTRRSEAGIYAIACAGLFAGLSLIFHAELIHITEFFATGLDRFSALFGANGKFGASYRGLPHLLFALFLWLSSLAIFGTQRRKAFIHGSTVILTWAATSTAILELLARSDHAIGMWIHSTTGTSEIIGIVVYGGLLPHLYLALIGPIILTPIRDATSKRIPEPNQMQRRLVSACYVLAAIAAVVAIATPSNRAPKPKTIAFFENGLLDFNVPNYDVFGSANTGMYGLWTERLSDAGNTIMRIPSISEASLSGTDVLVIANPLELQDSEVDAAISFVDRGGLLVCLADHTNIYGTQEAGNKLYEKLGAHLRFDSAFAPKSQWAGSLSCEPFSPLLPKDGTNRLLKYGTGGSLRLDVSSWEPLLRLSFGLSDIGNRANEPSYFGNKLYDHGERIGDLVLASERTYGLGRAIIFADTSSFQNLAVVHSGPYVVDRLLAPSSNRLPYATCVLFGVAAAGAILAFTRRPRLAIPAFLALVAIATLSGTISKESTITPDNSHEPSFVVDLSKANPILVDSFRNRSIDGLLTNATRAGFKPELGYSWTLLDELESNDVFCILSPRTNITDLDLGRLDAFMRRGGRAILSVGNNQRDNIESVQSRYGFAISGKLLGPIPIRQKMGAEEFVALRFSLQLKEAWELELSAPNDWERIEKVDGYTICAKRTVGNGSMTVISDARFLLDENLESESEAWLGNVGFLRTLITNTNPTDTASTTNRFPTAP